MGLSSNIIWHFTNYDSLVNIIKNREFKYSYGMESVVYSNSKRFNAAFPMVSFCNVPVADFSKYPTTYGGYAIGLTREWGVKQGGNSVWYCEPDMNLIKKIYAKLTDRVKSLKNSEDLEFLYSIISHIKNYEGPLYTAKHNYTKYRYFDETEFRIVPEIKKILSWNEKIMLYSRNEYNAFKKDNDDSPLIMKSSLPFSEDDVKYIVIEDSKKLKCFQELVNKDTVFFTASQIEQDIIGFNHKVINTERKRKIDNYELSTLAKDNIKTILGDYTIKL